MSPPENTAAFQFAKFVGVDEHQAVAATRNLRMVSLAPEEVLFSQGQPGDAVYLLVDGTLDVSLEGGDGAHHMATLEVGAALGHLGLLVDEPRSATVRARSAAALWQVDRATLVAAVGAGEVWAGLFLLATARQLAVLVGTVSSQLVTLVEEAEADQNDDPVPRVVELHELRRRLLSEWSF